MGFAGFRSGLQDTVNGWGLPDRIVRAFNDRLVHDVTAMSPTDFVMDKHDMVYHMTVEDNQSPGTYYVFSLRIRRNDMDFWIADITGFGYDEDNQVFWSSQSS